MVKDLDLSVGAGQIVALLGPNGAGKSTTLLGLVGELKPMTGVVNWVGQASYSSLHRRARAGLAFIPEERSVIAKLTAGENLRLGGGSLEVALELFPELRPLLPVSAGLLSGGEQQILTMARALSRGPRVLLADELSLGLAPLVTERLFRALQDAAGRGVGVLLVEQQVRSALEISNRAYVLSRGRVVMSGTSRELLGNLDEVEARYFED